MSSNFRQQQGHSPATSQWKSNTYSRFHSQIGNKMEVVQYLWLLQTFAGKEGCALKLSNFDLCFFKSPIYDNSQRALFQVKRGYSIAALKSVTVVRNDGAARLFALGLAFGSSGRETELTFQAQNEETLFKLLCPLWYYVK